MASIVEMSEFDESWELGADVSAAEEVRVPANALVLTPCLTREKILKRPLQDGDDRFFTMMSFDDLGCRIDYNTGFRIPDDCMPVGQGEQRVLCPGVEMKFQDDRLARLAAFTKNAAPIVTAIAPVLGPGLSAAMSGLLDEITKKLGLTGSSFLGDAIARLTVWFDQGVQFFFKQAPKEVIAAAKDTFKTLAVTAKALADTVKQAWMNEQAHVAALLAYTNARENVSVAANMLKGHASTINLVRGMAVDSVHAVKDFATAKIRQDALKSLGALQNTVGAVLDARGEVSPRVLEGLLADMPTVKNLTASQLGVTALRGFSLDVASDAVAKFADKPEAMIAAFEPEKLALLIPDEVKRFDFVNRALDAKAIDAMVAPFVTRAQQAFDRHLDAIKVQVANAPRTLSQKARRDFESATREALRQAEREADRTIQEGFALYRPFETGYGRR